MSSPVLHSCHAEGEDEHENENDGNCDEQHKVDDQGNDDVRNFPRLLYKLNWCHTSDAVRVYEMFPLRKAFVSCA